ncbi:hypothetical protein [Streptomyces sp. NPDC051219]|uniref:hypothetical protein n=1 Tax=Streptomyces sp. NPDC051219 TaxID=3155283 RepID=UPI00341D81D5
MALARHVRGTQAQPGQAARERRRGGQQQSAEGIAAGLLHVLAPQTAAVRLPLVLLANSAS